jgi:hypothetical protein
MNERKENGLWGPPRTTHSYIFALIIGVVSVLIGLYLIGPENLAFLRFPAGGLLVGIGLRLIANAYREFPIFGDRARQDKSASAMVKPQ